MSNGETTVLDAVDLNARSKRSQRMADFSTGRRCRALVALVAALSIGGCDSTGGVDSSASGTNSESIPAVAETPEVADAGVIELVAARLTEASDQWTAEQWYCVATQMAQQIDGERLRERFSQEPPSPGPAWSEAEATTYIDALWACTPQAELMMYTMISIDPTKEDCIRNNFDFGRIKAVFVANLMGAAVGGDEITDEMARVRDLCGVPSSTVFYGVHETIPYPVPLSECQQAESVLTEAVRTWYETHDSNDHPSGPELVEAGLLAEYDETLFKVLEGKGPEPSYVLPTLACAD